MYCSGKTRDGGTCSRRARFGRYCKTHLPASELPWRPLPSILELPANDVVVNYIGSSDLRILDHVSVSESIDATRLDSELPTLYDYIIRSIERGEFPRGGIHVWKREFDSASLGDGVVKLDRHGLSVIDNAHKLHVYRPRFSSYEQKRTWRAKNARIHEDRLQFLKNIEDGTRIRVQESETENYNKGFGWGMLLGGVCYLCASLFWKNYNAFFKDNFCEWRGEI